LYDIAQCFFQQHTELHIATYTHYILPLLRTAMATIPATKLFLDVCDAARIRYAR